MNSREINELFENTKQFKGVYPRDGLNFKLNKYTGCIINTDRHNEPGEHWVAVYMGDIPIYFDSFGLPPMFDEFVNFLDNQSPIGWLHNTIPFQSIYQDTCGMHCLFFLTCMFKYNDFNIFMNIFNKSKHENDILAKILYKTIKDV